jgi:hypothetical protein
VAAVQCLHETDPRYIVAFTFEGKFSDVTRGYAGKGVGRYAS